DRAWKSFSTDTTSLLEKIKNNKKGEYFNIVASQLQANLDGRIKTWAAKWQAAVYIKDGLCLHPRVSFVSNIGHDGTGVHSMETGTFKTDVLNTGIDLKKIPIIGSIAVEEVMEVFYKKMKPSLLKKTMNYLRQYKKMIK
ncbi:MAG: hypothetical protein KAS32_16110, partial [Candidatus Peribacteraceae bacterium]|nr:hypothetical protein [Candidatus Peribacteraceae bacterium]